MQDSYISNDRIQTQINENHIHFLLVRFQFAGTRINWGQTLQLWRDQQDHIMWSKQGKQSFLCDTGTKTLLDMMPLKLIIDSVLRLLPRTITSLQTWPCVHIDSRTISESTDVFTVGWWGSTSADSQSQHRFPEKLLMPGSSLKLVLVYFHL